MMSAELGTETTLCPVARQSASGSVTRHVVCSNLILQRDERAGEEYSAFCATF